MVGEGEEDQEKELPEPIEEEESAEDEWEGGKI